MRETNVLYKSKQDLERELERYGVIIDYYEENPTRRTNKNQAYLDQAVLRSGEIVEILNKIKKGEGVKKDLSRRQNIRAVK